jgi:transposase InsO family protein
MQMYSIHSNLPSVRRDAAAFAIRHGVRVAARRFGVHPGTISKWVKSAALIGYHPIPTRSSRPHHSPKALPESIVTAIIEERRGHKRCAEVVHQALLRQGMSVSLSSVKRTLDRLGMRKKRSPWKRPHDFTPRPEAAYSGALLEADTVHFILPDGRRLYVYTVIDLFSRWAYAEAVERIGAEPSARFITRSQALAPFRFVMIQTDHGSEFSTWFTHECWRLGIQHRHSRVRQKDDQAHIERFNRTIQEECLDLVSTTLAAFRGAIAAYLPYYNTERLHMGINFKTPVEMFPRS